MLKNEPGLSDFGKVAIASMQRFLLRMHIFVGYIFHALFREEKPLPCCSEEERLPLILMSFGSPSDRAALQEVFVLTVFIFA